MLWAALIANTELVMVLLYMTFSPAKTTNPLILVYPFIWINLSIWAVVNVDRPSTSSRQLLGAGFVSSIYFGVLLIAGGLMSPGHAFHGHSHGSTAIRLATTSLSPGWRPALLYGGDLIRVSLLPYQLIGYVALAYPVFVALLQIDGTVLSGVLGLRRV
jgi:hypothetical protein